MQRLLDVPEPEAVQRPVDEGNFRCVRCIGCNDCRFCVDSRDCSECTYCESCVACTGCTQSRGCRDCERTSHSASSRACDGCSYVTLCVGCEDCVHCFGCVGLSGAEFCILNEKHSRKDYQARIGELRTLLEGRIAEGWLPPWMDDEPSAASAPPEPEPEPTPKPEPVHDELRNFDDLDGIGSALPRDPVRAGLLDERSVAPPIPRSSPIEPLAPSERSSTGGSSRSVVRASRPLRAPEHAEPAPVAEQHTSVLVGRRPKR
ncbi:MAG: hypothetical protein IAG13_04325 [Deltaproteobacteria bacterium]|nr:hypothetical protein [Nannocystaceae bacterium]